MNEQIPESTAPPKRTGRNVGIGCLTVFSIVLALGVVLAMLSDSPKRNAALSVYGIPAIVAGAGAYLWWRAGQKRDRSERLVRHEKIVLKHAAVLGGTATLAQIVEATPLSSEEAAAALEYLGGKGLVHYDLLDDGTVLYRFGGLVGEG
jgi:hypothetical protein